MTDITVNYDFDVVCDDNDSYTESDDEQLSLATCLEKLEAELNIVSEQHKRIIFKKRSIDKEYKCCSTKMEGIQKNIEHIKSQILLDTIYETSSTIHGIERLSRAEFDIIAKNESENLENLEKIIEYISSIKQNYPTWSLTDVKESVSIKISPPVAHYAFEFLNEHGMYFKAYFTISNICII